MRRRARTPAPAPYPHRRALVLGAAVALICWSALPAAAQITDFCSRPLSLRIHIVNSVEEKYKDEIDGDCSRVTEEHMASVESMYVAMRDQTLLKSGDFSGLVNMTWMVLKVTAAEDLPPGVLSGMPALHWIRVYSFRFWNGIPSPLPEYLFDDVPQLRILDMKYNHQPELPAGIFEPLVNLEEIRDASYPPGANAGPEFMLVAAGARVELDGKGSDGREWGTNLAYSWEQTGGPAVPLASKEGAGEEIRVFFAPQSYTELEFTLTVRGAQTSQADEDTIKVVVVPDAPFAVSGLADATVSENESWSSPPPTLSGGAPSGSATWALVPVADAERFTIDAATGVVSMAARDWEDPEDADGNNVYQVTVRATDAEGRTATKSIAVTVQDVLEDRDFTISGLADASVAENQVWTSPTPGVAGDEPIWPVTWTIGGADAAYFTIDAATGQVGLPARDHELPQDAGENNVYAVTVTATDADGNSASTSLGVTVTDVPGDSTRYTVGAGIAVEVSRTSMSEADGEVAITAVLDAPRDEDVFVTVRAERGSGPAGSWFFLFGDTTLRISAGEIESSGAAYLVPFDDEYYTGDKQVHVFAAPAVRHSATVEDSSEEDEEDEEPPTAVITIVEDEAEPPRVNICARTPEVRDAILTQVSRVDDCSLTNVDDLRFTTLVVTGPSALRAGDFANLPLLHTLRVDGTDALQELPELPELPEGIFGGLSALRNLHLNGVGLDAVPAGLFAGLEELRTLYLHDNDLASLPAGVFAGLEELRTLYLHDNDLASLPAGVFAPLVRLEEVNLSGNQLTGLPEGIFAGMPRLRHVRVVQAEGVTPFTHLPARAFYGLDAPLTTLELNGVSLPVHLRASGAAGFRAVAPSAAPFDIVLPVTVTNGSIAGGAATITIAAGRIESDALQVTRTTGSTGAVTADIGTLPALPAGHTGYRLGKDAGRLPVTVIAATGAPAVTLELTDTSIAENGGSTTVTAQLDSAAGAEVRLLVFATPRAPAAVFDAAFGPNRALTIAAQQTASTGTVTITAVDNDEFAWDKEFELSAQVTAGSAVAPPVRTLTITEDDPRPVVSIALSPPSIAENGGTATLKAAIDTAVRTDTEVRWRLQPVAPALRSDIRLTLNEETYHGSSGVLRIAAGETESAQMVTVAAVNDVLHTGDKSVQVSASVVRGLPWLLTATKTLTIVEDDPSALTNGICDRTAGVKEQILAELDGVSDCALVTEAHLAGIDTLWIYTGPATTSLTPGDFAGLSGLTELGITGAKPHDTGLRPTDNITELPRRVFSGLANLRELYLGTLYLTALPDHVFAELSSLTELSIADTALKSLPSPAIFAGLTNLETLKLGYNAKLATLTPGALSELSNLRNFHMDAAKFPGLRTLPAGAFQGLSNLRVITFWHQGLRHLPAGAFDGLSSLTELSLGGNPINTAERGVFSDLSSIVDLHITNPWTSWPEGIFEGLSTLRFVNYDHSAVKFRTFPDRAFAGLSAPLELFTGEVSVRLAVSLESAGTGRFRAVAPSGAPFDMVLPVSVANGSIAGGATTVTIAAGSVHSEAVEVTRTEGSSAAVTVDLGALPSPPAFVRGGHYTDVSGHRGYALSRGSGLPLTVLAAADAATVTLVLTEPRIAENGGATAVTAALGAAAEADVTLMVSASAVAPAVPGDFRMSGNRRLTITTGHTESTGTVTVTAVDNDRYAGDRTVQVAASVLAGGAAPPAVQTLTIEEDDPPPPIELVLTPPAIDENGGRSVVTARVTAAMGAPVTVTVTATPLDPAVAGDFTLTGTTLTIAADATASSGEVAIGALDNDTDATPREVLVAATLDGVAAVDPPLPEVLTINDDDPEPAVTLELTPAEIAEAGGSALVTARLDRPSEEATTVSVSVLVSVAAGSVLEVTGDTLAIAAHATASTGTVRITAIDNDTDEPDRTVTVFGEADNALGVSGPAPATLTIADDDATPAATLALSQDPIAEGGSAALVTAALDRASSERTTFTVTATAVPPALATDFTHSGTALTIAAGALASTGTVTLAAADDAVYAGNKQVRVTAAVAGGRGVAAPDALTLTIEDDEPQPVITLLLGADRIAEAGGATEVTATVAPHLAADVTLTVAATPVAPALAADFTVGANRVLTIAAGQAGSTGTVTITAVDDSLSAERKTLQVTAAVSGARGVQAEPRILTIDDDEPRPQVSLTLTDDAIGERAGSTTVRATVDVAPAESIHLTLAAEPVAPAVAGDFRQQGSTLAFARGALASTGTVTVTAVDNDVDAPARSVRIGATVARGYAAAPAAAVLSITDDEAAPTVNLLLDPAAIGENGGQSRVTARLDHPSGTPTTVTVTTAPVAPAQAADFTQLGSTLTIAAGARASTGTVLVTALDNAVFGPPRTLQVAATADNDHGVTAPAARELAIDEDDAPPLVKIEMTDLQMPEAAGSVAVMVTFEDPVTEEVVYTVSATPLGAADAGDFSLSANRALTIAAGDTASSGTVTVTALPNEVDAPDRTIQVAATGGFPGLPEPAPAKLTITDDDAAPAVTLQVHPSATIDERRAVATVTAALDHPSSEDTTVRVTVAPVAPAVAADFTQEGTALRIRAGATTGSTTVRITAVDNDVDAPDKTLTVAGEAANLHGVAGNPAPLTLTVTDDEAAPAVRLLLDPAAIGENGGASRVTARLDHRSSAPTVVTVTAAPVAPALASHFTQAGSTLTIAAGRRRSAGTVRITAVDDDLYGPTREVTVSGTATNDQGLAGPPAARSLAIREDEPAPLLTLALTVEEIDEDGGTAGITGTIDRAMNQELTYTVSAAVQAPAAGDFTLSAEPVLTFPTGHTASAGTVTVTALADDVDAPDRTVRVAAEGGFPGLPAPQPKLLTILDDDAPPAVTLAVDPAEIAENGGSAAVTAALDHPSSADTTVRVATAPDVPATAADYTQRGTTLRIPAGERTGSGTVWVTAVDNDVDAPARTLSITGAATNAQGLAGQPAPVTLTVADDDAAPAVSLLLSHAEIVENGGETTVTARLDHPASVATTVTVTSTPQPPALAADFTQAGSTLTIAPGTRSSTGVVRISAVDNRLDAPDRTLTVSAVAVSEREVTGPAPRTLTIADDEPTPTVALLLTDNHLGENGGLTTVTARLDHPTIEATIVTVAARALPPALAADFALSANRALTIAARHTTSTGIVELATVDNEIDAPDKRVQVSATVTGGSGAQAPRVRTLTILDDEGAPTVTLALTDPEIAEGGTTTLRARLSAATSQTVSMRIAAAPHVTLSDYPVLTILPHHVTSGRAVTVTAAVDDVDAPDRTVELGTSLFNAPAGIVAPDAVSLRITDDDETPAVTLVLSASAIDENGGESMVSARLSHPSSDDTTVTVNAAAGSPGAPYFARHGSTLTIPSGARDSTGQVRITSVNDVLDAPDRTVVISGQAHNPRAVTGPAAQTLTILDDELLPAVTLELAPGTILEAGGSSTVTAALSGPSSAAVTVTVSVTPHAPAVDDDFRLSANRVLTIAAGARRAGGTLTITAVDNSVHEADKTLQVTAAVGGGHGVEPPPPRTLTVLEDDSEQIRVWLELDPAIATEGGEVRVKIRKSRASDTGLRYDLVDGDLYDLSYGGGFVFIPAAALEGNQVRTLAIGSDGAHGLPRTEWVRVAPRAGAPPAEPALLTVLDRDQPPAVTVIVTRPKIFEDGGESAVVAYLHGTDTRLSREDTTVTLTALPTPPATAADFTLSTTTLTIPAGEHTSAEAVFTAVNNGLDNADKRVRIRADAHNPAGVGMPGAVVVDIIDDEPAPTARLKLSPAAIGEANGVSAVTVVLDAPSANDTAVAVSAMPVTPARGADFTLGADSVLTVAARALESSGTVFITARDNVIAAPDKQVLLVPAVIAGRAAAGRAATLTILDDDTAPAVTLHLQPASIAENGGVAGVTATLDRAPGEVATVTVSATAVQPAVAADFSLSAGRVLTIAADATASTGTVRITARDNAAAGPPKLVLVEAVVSGGNGAAAPPPRTLTIDDDDVAPAVTLTVSPRSIAENGGVAEVTAALDRAASEATTVTVTATAVAPAAAGDFSVSGGPVLTIAMGDTASGATVRITAQDNAATGPPRQVRVEAVVSGGNGAAAPAPRTLTIVDDEVAPTVTLTLSPERIGEAGGSSAVTATYAPPPAASTTVTIHAIRASGPASPLAAGFQLRGSTLVFAAGVADSTNTVHIVALDDDLDAPDTTVSVTAAAHTGRVEAAARTLTIVDDDPTPVLTLALAPDTVDEGGVSTVTAALDRPSSAATVVTVAAAAQAPAQASDFALSANAALTIAPGARNSAGRVWIEALPNTVDEEQDARSVTVSAHVSGGRGVQPPAPRTLTIRDDDHTISGICARSRRVKEGILEQLGGISCAAVTAEHLAAVSQLLLTGTAPTAHDLLAGDFAGLTNLTYLDLSYGQVGTLLEGIFSGLAKLEYLGLAGNDLGSLPEGIFFGLRNLHLLNLAGNDLIRLPERVFRDVDLWELDLGENDLVTLPANVFSGQPRLYLLDLIGNDIATLPSAAFAGLSGLRVLLLHGNELTTLPAGIFADLRSLRRIYLVGNKLTGIAADQLVGMPVLGILDLRDNELTALAADAFIEVPGLDILRLIGNRLTELPANVFHPLRRLRHLYLFDNQLGTLPAGIFSRNLRLWTVELYGNPLTSLPADLLSGLPELRHVRLGAPGKPHHLSSLPERTFAGLPAPLRSLNLFSRDHGADFPLEVSLRAEGSGRIRAVAAYGAPFDIVLPVSVTNGTIDGGATTVTIPAGAVRSAALQVTRIAGTTAAIDADIGALPEIPSGGESRVPNSYDPRTDDYLQATTGHWGYRLTKAVVLPVAVDERPQPRVELVLAPPAVAEDGGVSRVTARLASTVTAPVTLAVAAAPVAPALARDFSLGGAALTIAAGTNESIGTVTVTAVADERYVPGKRVVGDGRGDGRPRAAAGAAAAGHRRRRRRAGGEPVAVGRHDRRGRRRGGSDGLPRSRRARRRDRHGGGNAGGAGPRRGHPPVPHQVVDRGGQHGQQHHRAHRGGEQPGRRAGQDGAGGGHGERGGGSVGAGAAHVHDRGRRRRPRVRPRGERAAREPGVVPECDRREGGLDGGDGTARPPLGRGHDGAGHRDRAAAAVRGVFHPGRYHPDDPRRRRSEHRHGDHHRARRHRGQPAPHGARGRRRQQRRRGGRPARPDAHHRGRRAAAGARPGPVAVAHQRERRLVGGDREPERRVERTAAGHGSGGRGRGRGLRVERRPGADGGRACHRQQRHRDRHGTQRRGVHRGPHRVGVRHGERRQRRGAAGAARADGRGRRDAAHRDAAAVRGPDRREWRPHHGDGVAERRGPGRGGGPDGHGNAARAGHGGRLHAGGGDADDRRGRAREHRHGNDRGARQRARRAAQDRAGSGVGERRAGPAGAGGADADDRGR